MREHVALGLHIISRASLGATWEGAIPKVGLVEPSGWTRMQFPDRLDRQSNAVCADHTMRTVLSNVSCT